MSATGLPTTVLPGTWHPQHADGGAAVLAIGTATPVNCVGQDEFVDWYFRVTNSQHLTVLQAKAKKICAKSDIKKRHLHHIEQMIDEYPEILDRDLPSLGPRLSVAADAVPELAAAAAAKAIAEWRRPAADITHLVVSTNSGAQSPGADLRLAKLLGLNPAVHRTLLYFNGCSGGCAGLRLAKDIAENNHGARVLVACADVALAVFGAPPDQDQACLGSLVVHCLWGDGAGAVIVGAGSTTTESPIFQMVSSSQLTLPGTDHLVGIHVRESGVDIKLSPELPALVRNGIEESLAEMLAPQGFAGGRDVWNSLFWAAHPGGRAILDSYEAALGLKPGKLAASRHVLSEHGNMLGATIIFVLDEIRCRRERGDEDETGNTEWGLLLGLGPGVTIETMVLRATTSQDGN